MYPRAFHYHRASSLREAAEMLSQLGEGAKLLAGGQSLIPLMKLRFANPADLVDLNFIGGTSYIKQENGAIHIGALTRHAEIQDSAAAAKIPILHDCAAGIADVQVRNRGTIGGSLAEADPSGDWATVLMTLTTDVHCLDGKRKRSVPLRDFVKDAYTTALSHDELVSEVSIQLPPKGSGGAYIALGCVGLTPVRPSEAESALRGQRLSEKTIAAAAEGARSACDPQGDMRGSAEYKREVVGALVKRAIEAAVRRARGEQVEVSHLYA